MNPLVKNYLETLDRGLKKLPEKDRLEIVHEIKSHIAEGIRNGQLEPVILEKLGDPRKLAKAYRSEHLLQQNPTSSMRKILRMIGFYSTTGLLSVIIVPILATIVYGFGFCTVLVILAGIIRSFGVTWIQMDIGPGISVPTEWSMVFALVVGGMIGSIAYFSWKYLKVYLAFVSKQYRSILPVNRYK